MGEAYGRLLADGITSVSQNYVDQYDYYIQPSLEIKLKLRIMVSRLYSFTNMVE